MRVLRVAACNLNKLAMDFEANLKNIKDSIAKGKESGAVIRVGPELEIPGYGCEDHFLEPDTITHSWECLKEILTVEWTDGILCSIGMPVIRTLQLPSLMYEQYKSNDQTKAKACRLRQFHGVQMVQAMASKSTSR